jgi:hypothetical protein
MGGKGSGGRRANAGAKPKENKKVKVQLYVLPSNVETVKQFNKNLENGNKETE